MNRAHLFPFFVLALCASQAFAQELFRDDFNAASLDGQKWSVANWKLGQAQLRNTPVLENGIARLRFDTFNPDDPGKSFAGTEIYTKQEFSVPEQGALEMEARIRVNQSADGLVAAFFTYVSKTKDGKSFSDEIDFEFLTKQINASTKDIEPVHCTTYNDFDNQKADYENPVQVSSQTVEVPGLDVSAFTTIKIRWSKDKVEWWVNDKLIRSATQAVPDAPTALRINFWAVNPSWTAAHSESLKPAPSAVENQFYFYDVDYVVVRTFSPPPAQ